MNRDLSRPKTWTVGRVVTLWLDVRDDPSNLKMVQQQINLFLKHADFETENAYYMLLHEKYMDGWQRGNAAVC